MKNRKTIKRRIGVMKGGGEVKQAKESVIGVMDGGALRNEWGW